MISLRSELLVYSIIYNGSLAIKGERSGHDYFQQVRKPNLLRKVVLHTAAQA